MKFIGHIFSFAITLALLAAGLVVGLEMLDRLAEKNRFRYMISEDFES